MTTTLAVPPALVVADLLLVRMALPNPRPKKVREDLGKLLNEELSPAAFEELRSALTDAGFLTKSKRNTFALTDTGRERGLRFLGLPGLPPRTNWSKVIAKYLFPKAAGLSGNAAAKLDNGDKLAAFILKRKYGLGAGAGSTVKQLAEAIACKELGFPEETTLQGLLCAVLSRLLGSERLPKDKLIKQLPLFETELKTVSTEAARRKVVRDWLDGAPAPERPVSPTPPFEPFDLPAFAATVKALAADSPPEARFHGNKVFIAALWRASQRELSLQHISLPDFKRRLVEANAQHLLHLSRADLVQAMDPQLVADSETVYLNATFHFVLLEGDRP
ncbi:MAG: hypothetical protein ACYC3I_11440 [Gemmataceae bacterium]